MSIAGRRFDSKPQRTAMTCQGQSARKPSAQSAKTGPLARRARAQKSASVRQPESAIGRRSAQTVGPSRAIKGMAR